MFLLATILATISCVYAQSKCSFTDAAGYSIKWSSDGNNIFFDLSFPNFPDDSWTAVAFGLSMASGLDVCLVQVSNQRIQVLDANAKGYGPPQIDAQNSINVISTSYSNNNLKASFSRPITPASNNNEDTNLAGCNTWNFVTSPGKVVNGQFQKHGATPKQLKVCDVARNCRR